MRGKGVGLVRVIQMRRKNKGGRSNGGEEVEGEGEEVEGEGEHTMFRPRHKLHLLALLLREQPIMRPEPRPILWIRARIVGQAAEADVPAYGGEVATGGVDYVVDALVEGVHG